MTWPEAFSNGMIAFAIAFGGVGVLYIFGKYG